MVNDIYNKLLKAVEALPPEAIERASKEKTRKGYDTTGYQYQYLVNVCNEVLGIDGWGFSYEIVADIAGVWGEKKKAFREISVNLTMWIKFEEVEIIRTCGGGHKADMHGDALKGAITNALKKTMALFGIGKKAYEGTIDDDYLPIPEGNGDNSAPDSQPDPPLKPKTKKKLEHQYVKPDTKPQKKTGSNKYVFTPKRREALERIIKSHLLTGAEKDDVTNLYETCKVEQPLNEDTLERLNSWFTDWFGTKEKNYEDGQSFIRHQAEEKNEEDLPF